MSMLRTWIWSSKLFALECSHKQITRKLSASDVYDVLVVGGGHAGTEAACAAARMGARTVLVTHKASTIGEMSCNPSFGGVGKGHLMKEIDALGGVCALACDKTGCHYRVLNKGKGPAVWGPRAQIDRDLYRAEIQRVIAATPNLTVIAQPVDDLLLAPPTNADSALAQHACCGVKLESGGEVHARTVVLTTGTFLRGCINTGPDVRPAGRLGDQPAIALANTLDRLGFTLGRLKTGTPPRLDGRTIDYTQCEKQLGDDPIQPFSYMNDSVTLHPRDQLMCYLTYVPDSPEFRSLIIDNMHLNRHVREEVTGPRYCPSIESKILRFPNKQHQVWLEPEGFNTDLVYPQGISCTLPADLQQKMVNMMPGLEQARVVQPGYGVEYDFLDPRQIRTSLETHKIQNLFFAGQINGTTGYEEAGAQGVMAGINAALKVQGRPALNVSRTEGYIGVLIDDLTTQGTSEPYRMFTSRAEFRLHLRADNADLRLTQKGYDVGCVSEERYARYTAMRQRLEDALALLKDYVRPHSFWRQHFSISDKNNHKKEFSAMKAVVSGWTNFSGLAKADSETFKHLTHDPALVQRLMIHAVYEHSLKEQWDEIAEVRREEALVLPDDLNYSIINNLSLEMREKLCTARPQTIAAASRIQGMSPAALYALLKYVKKNHVSLS